VQALVKKGFAVNVEQGAGVAANFNNQEYEAAGAKITQTKDIYNSNIVLKACLFYVVPIMHIFGCSVAFLMLKCILPLPVIALLKYICSAIIVV
jgi:Alanine dehydrogenase/PNT, N-terminal domain